MPIYCDKCGHQNRNTVKFCQSCGEEVIATTETGNLKSGVLLDDRYEITGLIKSGGMGSIYKGLDHRFRKKPCAVKEMLCQSNDSASYKYLKQRFEKEAELLHDLRHPHLPVVKDYFAEGGRYYLVMDFIEGKDLEAVLEAYFPRGVTEAEVIEWSIQILDALDYLHSQSPPIIYRDLKPGNIMIQDKDKKAILVDFGIARTINPAGQTTMTTVGTPAYSPQELFQGKAEPRTDIYSMGATMHALLAGEQPLVPFSFKPLREINPHISEDIEEIVMRALSEKPEDRFSKAREMKEALEKLPARDPSPRVILPVSDKPEPSLPSIADLQRDTEAKKKLATDQPTLHPDSYSTASVKKADSEEAKPASLNKAGGSSKKLLIPVLIGVVLLCIVGLVFAKGIFNKPPDFSEIMSQAKTAFDNTNYGDSKNLYTKALEMKENNIDALYGLAESCYMKGECEEALENYKKVLDIDKTHKGAQDRILELAGSEKETIADSATEALNKFEMEPEIDNIKAEILSLLETKQEKREISKKLFSMLREKKLDEFYFEAGNFFMGKEKYEQAAGYFEKSLKEKPDKLEASEKLSECYMKTGKYTEAINLNGAIVKSDPGNVKALISTGEASYKLGNYKDADEYLKEAMNLKPDKNQKTLISSIYLSLAKSSMEKGDYQSAKNYYKEAEKIEPENAEAKEGLAGCYLKEGEEAFKAGDYEKAEECFSKVINLNPGNDLEKKADDGLAKVADATYVPPANDNTGGYTDWGSSGGTYSPDIPEAGGGEVPDNIGEAGGGVVD